MRVLAVGATGGLKPAGGAGALGRLRRMGKRGRRRVVEESGPVRQRVVWQTARVRVDDATWAEYRASLGERSVAEALGAYVELEVARWRRQRATDAALTDRELAELVERIEASRAALDALARRLALR